MAATGKPYGKIDNTQGNILLDNPFKPVIIGDEKRNHDNNPTG